MIFSSKKLAVNLYKNHDDSKNCNKLDKKLDKQNYALISLQSFMNFVTTDLLSNQKICRHILKHSSIPVFPMKHIIEWSVAAAYCNVFL